MGRAGEDGQVPYAALCDLPSNPESSFRLKLNAEDPDDV